MPAVLPPRGARRLLLVEDDPATRSALARLLARCGLVVEVARTVAEARFSLAGAPDLVVLDLMLPDGSGATLLRAIREAGLACRVAVTTGSADRDLLDLVRSLEPDAILTKPVRFEDLLAALGLA